MLVQISAEYLHQVHPLCSVVSKLKNENGHDVSHKRSLHAKNAQ
jgi:hypothetical protein